MSLKRLVPLNTVSLTANPSSAIAGDIYYNSTSSELRYYNGTNWIVLAGSVNALVDAKSIYQDVRNQSGSNFSIATPVYISGSEGASGKMLISAASNASEATSSKTMGLTTSAISNNSNGQVISEGLLEGIDTTGAADGDPVWLGVDGAKIYGLANKPSAPAHLVFLGIVIRGGSATTGSIYVKIQNGFELQEIHNVEISSLVNGNVLAYDSATQTWKNTNTLQSTASTTPLVVKASASQSVDIFQIQNSSGNPIFYINQYNQLIGNQPIYQYNTLYLGSPTTSAIPLTVRGAASQTANLQEWQDSAGTMIARITNIGGLYVNSNISQNSSGRTFLGGTADHNAFLNVSIPTASRQGVVIRANASQTANLQEWQSNAGGVLSYISAAGSIFASNSGTRLSSVGGDLVVIPTSATVVPIIARGFTSQTADLQNWQNNAGTTLAAVTSSGRIWTTSITVAANGGVTTGSQFGVAISSAANIGAVIKGASSQTANLQEWQDSSGTVLSNINNVGAANFVRVGIGGATPSTVPLFVTSPNSTYIAAIVRGAPSQTANLTEWQDTSGAIRTSVSAFGVISHGNPAQIFQNSGGTDSRVSISTVIATATGIIIRGVASQTANLQEWQNSAGTVLARVDADGAFYAGGLSAYTNGNVSIGNTLSASYMQTVYTMNIATYASGPASQVPLTINGVSGQTGNLTEWKSDVGTVLARISNLGGLYVNSNISQNSSGRTFLGGTADHNAFLNVSIPTASRQGVVIRANASQTANLQEWQSSAGGVLSYISPAGSIFASNSGTRLSGVGGDLVVIPTSATVVPIVARGYASQTANLQEWQNSSGTALVNISSSGVLNTNANINLIGVSAGGLNRTIDYGNSYGAAALYLYNAGANARWGWGLNAGEMQFFATNDSVNNHFSWNRGGDFQAVGTNEIMRLTVGTGATSTLNLNTGGTAATGLVIKGAASQTANLQEWQNSAGTILSKIDASGSFYAGNSYFTSSNTYVAGTLSSSKYILGGDLSLIPVTGGQSAISSWWGLQLSGLRQSNVDYTPSNVGAADVAHVIMPLTQSAAIGLLIVGAGSQSGNLTEWRNNAGTTLASISASGSFTVPSLTVSGDFTVNGTTTNINTTNLVVEDKNITIADVSTPTDTTADGAGITIKGATDKTFNWVQSSGRFVSSEPVQSSAFIGTSNIYTPQLGSTVIGSATLNTNADTGGILINTAGASNKGLIVKGAASQTADLQQWQDTSGTVLGSVVQTDSNNMVLRLPQIQGKSGAYPWISFGSSITNTANQATDKPLVVKGATSQSANLTEWQNSSGTVLARVDSTGQITSTNGTQYGTIGSSGFQSGGASGITDIHYNGGNVTIRSGSAYSSNTSLLVGTGYAGGIGQIIKGFASQTANLQEWQNSAGTVLSSIDASGSFTSVSQPIQVAGSTYGFSKLVAADLGATSYWKIATLPSSSLGTYDQINIDAMLGGWGSTAKTRYEIMLGNRDAFAYKYTKFGDGLTQSRIQSYLEADGSVSVYLYSENTYTTLSYNITLSTTPGAFSATIYKNPTASTTTPTGTKVFDTGEPATYIPLINMNNAGLLSAKNGAFTSTSTSAVTLTVQSAASQTANIQEWKNNAGTTAYLNTSLQYFNPGRISVVDTNFSAILSIFSGNPAAIVSIFRGAASQTADLAQWQSSAGTTYLSVTNAGTMISNGGVTIASNPTINAYGAAMKIASGVNSYPMLILQAAASQTANIQQWQNSGGTTIASIDAYGNAGFGGSAGNSSQGLLVKTNSNPAVKGIIVIGATSQTANLQEWQDNSGTALATLSASGAFTAITKSFDIPHPTKENMRLRYGSLEGPENGVYVRGKSKENYIQLPDYWTGLVDENSITVNITPIGKKQKIYVDKIENNKVYLGGNVKEYFFTVYGERKDVDKLTVEY